MKTIFLMRHGETLFNVMDVNQGQCDSPLTENGINQALAAKEWFKNQKIHFDSVYSSTAERACDTAWLVSWMPYERKKGLKEIFLGTKEASPNSENPEYPYGDYFVQFGGEDLDAFTDRIYGAVREIAREDTGETILIVTHGMAMRRFLRAVGYRQDGTGFIGNCGIVQLQYEEDTFEVRKIINPAGTAQNINILGKFCGKRDVERLTSEQLQKKYGIAQADIMVLFGGSILAGGDILAEAIKEKIAKQIVLKYGFTNAISNFVDFKILLIIVTFLACKHYNFINGGRINGQVRETANIFGFHQSLKSRRECTNTSRLIFQIIGQFLNSTFYNAEHIYKIIFAASKVQLAITDVGNIIGCTLQIACDMGGEQNTMLAIFNIL